MSKILIIDDNPQNIQVLATLLNKNNYEIEYSMSGKEGLEWVENEEFDLILLDIMMPEMDGFETCQRLKNNPKSAHLPIIFLTAKNDKETMLKGFDMGANDFISKPFDSRELYARVKMHIELKEIREELQHHNKLLEEKVDLRTIELRNALSDLEKVNNHLVFEEKSKSNFLNIIAKQIRTPLSELQGITQLLKYQTENPKFEPIIDNLDSAVTRLENFVTTALKIVAIKSGNYKYSPTEINLNDLIEFAILQLKNRLFQKKITIKTPSDNSPIVIWGEEELLLNCIYNILNNAIKYSKSESVIDVSINKYDTYTECIIVDNGQGFSEEKLENVFSLFDNHQNSVDNQGLGLPFSKTIMDFHGGEISASNIQPSGAMVKLVFKKRVV